MPDTQPDLFAVPDEPPASEPAAPAPEAPAPTLEALITAARLASAKKADGGQVGTLIKALADRDGGAALVADLRAEGFTDAVIAEAVSTDTEDKRKKARVALGIIAGEPVVWLRTSGWQSSGKTGGRERHPSAESVRHAAAPRQLEQWLHHVSAEWPVRFEVGTGPAVKALTQQITATAWARIGVKDTDPIWGELIAQSGNPGVVPDAVLVERWATAADFQQAWGRAPIDEAERAEVVCAVEIEDTAKQVALVRRKVARYDAAVDAGALHGVLWVTRTEAVARTLTDVGVGSWCDQRLGATQSHWTTRQWHIPAGLVGLPGADRQAVRGPVWWPLRFQHGLASPPDPEAVRAAARASQEAAPTPFSQPPRPYGHG